MLREVIHEFKVLEFTNLICKLDRLWISVTNWKLKFNSKKSHGYGGTIGCQKESNFSNDEKGKVCVNYGPGNMFLNAFGSRCKVVDKI